MFLSVLPKIDGDRFTRKILLFQMAIEDIIDKRWEIDGSIIFYFQFMVEPLRAIRYISHWSP